MSTEVREKDKRYQNTIIGIKNQQELLRIDPAAIVIAAYITTDKGDEPYPESLEEDYALASSRDSATKSQSTDLGEHVNFLVRKALQESERPRGKTHVNKPSDRNKDKNKDNVEGSSKCYVCQGALNHLPDGKPYYAKSCQYGSC
jgi:hypothetical protein